MIFMFPLGFTAKSDSPSGWSVLAMVHLEVADEEGLRADRKVSHALISLVDYDEGGVFFRDWGGVRLWRQDRMQAINRYCSCSKFGQVPRRVVSS